MSFDFGVLAALLAIGVVSVTCSTKKVTRIFLDTDWIQADPASQGVDPAKLQVALDYLKSICGDDGISQALVTTALGLIVAIPLLFLHTLVTSRSRLLVQILDEQSAGLVAMSREDS